MPARIKFIAIIILVASFGLSSCKECDQVKEQMIDPINMARIYMDASPSGQALAETGCRFLVFHLKNLREAASVLREFAMSKYSPAQIRCEDSVESTRYVCTAPDFNGSCEWTPFSQCRKWAKDIPGGYQFDQTVKLSQYIDSLDLIVQNTCKLAMDGRYYAAELQAEGVRRFIREKLVGEGLQFFQSECTKRGDE